MAFIKVNNTVSSSISPVDMEALKKQYESTFKARAAKAFLGLNVINTLKAQNIGVMPQWNQSNSGHWYYNLSFIDKTCENVSVDEAGNIAEESNQGEGFSRNALIGFIKTDGTVQQYTYESVLKARMEKAIARVLYERLIIGDQEPFDFDKI